MVLFLRVTRLEPVFRGRGKVPESRGGLYEFDPYLCLTQEASPETHHTTLQFFPCFRVGKNDELIYLYLCPQKYKCSMRVHLDRVRLFRDGVPADCQRSHHQRDSDPHTLTSPALLRPRVWRRYDGHRNTVAILCQILNARGQR
jgi:hypothetical protein